MEHVFFSDGGAKRISWLVQTKDSTVEQKRDHVEIYFDKVSKEQSKYIALHVGIFWCIGRFIIKNNDTVNVMIDSKSMYEHLANNSQISDDFIEVRTNFIKQLIDKRKLKINYHLVKCDENLASKLL